MRLRVQRADILEFLLKRKSFPRSINHSLGQVEKCLSELPEPQDITSKIKEISAMLMELETRDLKQEALHQLIDDIQAALIVIHDSVKKAYF